MCYGSIFLKHSRNRVLPASLLHLSILQFNIIMEKEQFDEFLGGKVQLPRDVQIVKLAAARATEIAAMSYSIENPQQSKLIFQKLPVHMRRRVMSHNAKRMPRRLREAHLNQMKKSGLPPKSKKPSRKYRRRPKNLAAEYERRKSNCRWLETHIWHAKRFRMIRKWGWKIGERRNDKSFRACYRAAANHCLLMDNSYYACLELKGPEDILKAALLRHCNPGCLTFAAKIYLRGNREGNVVFYKENTFPYSPIARVNFLWKPSVSQYRHLWIWIHPIYYDSFLREIVQSFKFKRTNVDTKNLEIWENDKNCTMTNLANSLNRFRLVGPLSSAILTDSLRLPNLNRREDISNKSTEERNCMEIDSAHCNWYENFYNDSENFQSFIAQKESMEDLRNIKSPNQSPANYVLGITALDPRFFLPEKRTKIIAKREYCDNIISPRLKADQSPLWNPEVRTQVKNSYKSTHEINKLRSKNLVPGILNDDRYDEEIISKVPVMLIQNPGCNGKDKSIGFASGFDVIIPAGWSMPFWQSFILRGARAGGLKESRSMALEKLDIDSPETLQPDMNSHEKEALERKKELRDVYFRRPPNRRVNFTKFAISSPFYCEWKILMKEWTGSEEFYVLRDRELLEKLQKALSPPKITGKNTKLNNQKVTIGIDKTIFSNFNCLVPMKISIEGKGRLRNFAVICKPTEEDMKKFGKTKNWSGPVQKSVADPNHRRRRELRKNHKSILKRALRRRQRLRKLARETADLFKLKKRTGNSTKLCNETNSSSGKSYLETMQELYLPKCDRVRYSCNREVMGYVTRADFSFSEAREIGIGYVTLESFFQIIDSRCNLILTRNTQTRQYRFATVEILNRYTDQR